MDVIAILPRKALKVESWASTSGQLPYSRTMIRRHRLRSLRPDLFDQLLTRSPLLPVAMSHHSEQLEHAHYERMRGGGEYLHRILQFSRYGHRTNLSSFTTTRRNADRTSNTSLPIAVKHQFLRFYFFLNQCLPIKPSSPTRAISQSVRPILRMQSLQSWDHFDYGSEADIVTSEEIHSDPALTSNSGAWLAAEADSTPYISDRQGSSFLRSLVSQRIAKIYG
nr:hypothetical protein Iba_chr11dCG6510 [Ipomoea batatas]